MPLTHDEALTALFQAPHESFVAERKRLSAELRAAGDKAGAAALMKVNRPALSVWVVNQLWWKNRDPFLLLLGAAKRVKAGELTATAQHRDALNALREKAVKVLTEAGHAAPEATLRRVTTTLSALAASGGFEPDPEGGLREDRDPPGFEVMGAVPGGAVWSPAALPTPPEEKKEAPANPFLSMRPKPVGTEVPPVVTSVPTVSEDEDLERAAREAEEAAQRATALAAAAKERLAEANAKRVREETLRAAKAEVERLRRELKAAEARVAELES
jgi:hypothetical protein